jgi:DNA invertase Pin-like site-specific DNA recombinase
VRSLREAVDVSTPTERAVTSIMATIAELELELGKERRAASREARVARSLAATKPMKLDEAQQTRLLCLYLHGEPVSELTTLFGISRSTLFRSLKVLKQRLHRCEPVAAIRKSSADDDLFEVIPSALEQTRGATHIV